MKTVASMLATALAISFVLLMLGPAETMHAGVECWYLWGVAYGIFAGVVARDVVAGETIVTSWAVVRARRAYNRDVQHRAADFISLGVPHATAIERAVREKALEAQQALGL